MFFGVCTSTGLYHPRKGTVQICRIFVSNSPPDLGSFHTRMQRMYYVYDRYVPVLYAVGIYRQKKIQSKHPCTRYGLSIFFLFVFVGNLRSRTPTGKVLPCKTPCMKCCLYILFIRACVVVMIS